MCTEMPEALTLNEQIENACRIRALRIEHDVHVGPYLAPIVIEAYDPSGVARNVRILVEPRHWSLSVAKRLAGTIQNHRDRLCKLTRVDFVAIVVGGSEEMPAGLTSLGELEQFLDGFAPPLDSVGMGKANSTENARSFPSTTDAYERDISDQIMTWTGQGLVFCAMPFAPEFDSVFFELIAPAVADAGLTVLRTDQEETLKPIDRRIRDGIRNSALVLGDTTGLNPNVMYEIGLAHSLKKDTLLLRHDDGALPFDLRNIEVLQYSMPNCGALKPELSSRLKSAVNEIWGRSNGH